MNNIFRVIWNTATSKWVVASDPAEGQKNRSSGKTIALTLAALSMGAMAPVSFANGATEENTVACSKAERNDEGECLDGAAKTSKATTVISPRYAAGGGDDGNGGNNASRVAIGSGVVVGADSAVGIGSQLTVKSANAVVLGSDYVSSIGNIYPSTDTRSTGAFVVNGLVGASPNAIALLGEVNGVEGGVAIGRYSQVTQGAGISIGQSSLAYGPGSMALGVGAEAIGINNVALGAGSTTSPNRSGVVSVGNSGTQRQIINVADGTEDTDAVNVRQLKSAGLVDANGELLNAAVYDTGSNRSKLTFGGATGTLLTNVMAGSVAPGSMDAINGSQWWDMQDQVNKLGDRVSGLENEGVVDPEHPVNPPGGGTVTDNGGQIIGNVGDGVAPSDAATVGQVSVQTQDAISTANSYTDSKVGALSQQIDQFKSSVDRRFQAQDERISRIGAMGAAYAQMSFSAQGVDTPNRLGVGVGTQSGHSAIAVGYSRNVAKNVNLSFGGSASGSETSGGVGLGVGW